MTRSSCGLGVALAAALGMGGPALAVLDEREVAVEPQGWTVALENDLFSGRHNQDRWFTNGIQVAAAYRRGREPILFRPLRAVGRGLFVDPNDCKALACDVTITVAAGQNMYTPRHIDIAEPQPRDRPWAGWAYVGAGVSHYRGNRHQVLALKLGPTGPAALAEQAQAWVHRRISGSPRPLGWDNQLRPRLGVQLSYQSTSRFSVLDRFGLQLAVGGSIGNLRTMGRVAAGLQWSAERGERARLQPGTLDEGEFLVPDFNSAPSDGTLAGALRRTVVYAHAAAAVVAYNAFLEGRTYAGRPQIEPLERVYCTTLGFVVPLGGRGEHKVGLAFKRRTPEFSVRGETARDAYHRWGVLTYSRDFES